MVLPTSAFGVLVVVALVLPGIVYAAARTALQGYVAQDRSVSARVLQAVLVSALLDALYLTVTGGGLFRWFIDPAALTTRIWLLGPAVLLFGVLIPAALAYVIYGNAPWLARVRKGVVVPLLTRLTIFLPGTGYHQTPTAWDWVAPKKGDKWIRVLNASGRWVGGWSTEDTFFSSYPEARDIYIPEQWDLDEDGRFLQRSARTSGVWLSLEGAQLVEWFEPDDGEENEVCDGNV